jgi:hypothetical protein
MTDPKSRKVILVEHPLLPLYIKEIIARVLFKNLQACIYLIYQDMMLNRGPGPFHIICPQSIACTPHCRPHHRSGP